MMAGSEAWKRVLDHDGTRRLLEQLSVFLKPGDRRRRSPFRKRSMPFSRHLRKFFNYQQIFLYLIKEKGKYASNHPVSNPEPLLPNIPLIPLHYQIDPPNFRKI